MNKIKLSSIVAAAKNHTIGKDDKLLWHLPEDFKHFKRTTMGCPMIMGRKTFDSLPGVLKGRDHIIITRTPREGSTHTHYVSNIDEAITLGQEIAEKDKAEELFIIGGGEIYRQTMPAIDHLYLTLVDREYEGDTHFPEINWGEWKTLSEEKHDADLENDRPGFTIFTLERT